MMVKNKLPAYPWNLTSPLKPRSNIGYGKVAEPTVRVLNAPDSSTKMCSVSHPGGEYSGSLIGVSCWGGGPKKHRCRTAIT